ncbi:hypothetical protein OG520_38040 [Streptomyces sp. NBC_00984]|uniref:hypothetical protein n=1 Tax=Streptomyces sp. NBC_00984 TaxID=2903700 RepID=UPI0038696505|nr:hypothetical protein OG520_38040 [Streptomyces sp. NBC_00984]
MSIPYVLGLSVLSEVSAILAIGLVRRWSEAAPIWIPIIGGKRIRPMTAVVPAVIGGLILTMMFTDIPIGDGRRLTAYGVIGTVDYTNDAWQALATVCVSRPGHGDPSSSWPSPTTAAVEQSAEREGGRCAVTCAAAKRICATTATGRSAPAVDDLRA